MEIDDDAAVVEEEGVRCQVEKFSEASSLVYLFVKHL